MAGKRPRTQRTQCVVVDDRRSSVDSFGPSAAVRRRRRDSAILESILSEIILKTDMSDREKLLKQWRNLPVNNRVTWETFKRQQRPKIIRQSRPDDEIQEVLKRIGRHCYVAVRRQSMPNII